MVAFAITPDRAWEVTIDELVAATSAAGFEALGIVAENIDGEIIGAYDRAGLRCHEVLALVIDDDEAAAVAGAEGVAATAARIGSEWVLTVFGVGLDDRSRKTIERCAAIYAEAGVGMAVEFSPYRPVASIPEALEVVDVASRQCRAGVLIDTWHFSFGVSTWEDLDTIPLDRIAYIQFADGLEPVSNDVLAETMYRRALPGKGILELGRFAATLLDRGWDGCVSVEVLSAELRSVPAGELARSFAESTVPYWR